VSLAGQQLGYRPIVPLEEGLRRTIATYRKPA
jgi:nucleoside-diphosphate-sugar epimerase